MNSLKLKLTSGQFWHIIFFVEMSALSKDEVVQGGKANTKFSGAVGFYISDSNFQGGRKSPRG